MRAQIAEIAKLLEPLGAAEIGPQGGGADINPLAQASGGSLPTMSPSVDGSRYFIYHHTPADTIERLDPEEIASCVAGIAVLAYVVADMPVRLGN